MFTQGATYALDGTQKNALCLSSASHRKAHNQPLWFAEQVRKIKGQAVVDYLKRKTQNLKAITIQDMEKIYKSLKSSKI